MLLLSAHNDVQHGCDASTPVFARVSDSFPDREDPPRRDSELGHRYLDRKTTNLPLTADYQLPTTDYRPPWN